MEKIPDATLHVYGKPDIGHTFTDSLDLPSVTVFGSVSHDKIISGLLAADIWYYPNYNVLEPYCITALEAMACGCLCISVPLGNLKYLLDSGRGILINDDKMGLDLMDQIDCVEFEEIRKKGTEWAKTQTWDGVGQQWVQLLKE